MKGKRSKAARLLRGIAQAAPSVPAGSVGHTWDCILLAGASPPCECQGRGRDRPRASLCLPGALPHSSTNAGAKVSSPEFFLHNLEP